MLTQQENITEGNFCSLQYIISVFQSSIHTIGKFERIGTMMLYIICQGYLTLGDSQLRFISQFMQKVEFFSFLANTLTFWKCPKEDWSNFEIE